MSKKYPPDSKQQANEIARKIYGKRITQYNMKGNKVKTFNSIAEAAEDTGITGSQIGDILAGRSVSSAGFVWRYGNKQKIDLKTFLEKRKATRNPRMGKEISQYDLKGKRIATYRSINEASRATGIATYSIGKVVLGKSSSAGGFFWMEGTGKENRAIEG